MRFGFWRGVIRGPAVAMGVLAGFGVLRRRNEADRTPFMRHIRWGYFWFGEEKMAAILAGMIAGPPMILRHGRAEVTLAFIGAAVPFLPQLIQRAMKADAGSDHPRVRESLASPRFRIHTSTCRNGISIFSSENLRAMRRFT